jgi:hypothetical protein
MAGTLSLHPAKETFCKKFLWNFQKLLMAKNFVFRRDFPKASFRQKRSFWLFKVFGNPKPFFQKRFW